MNIQITGRHIEITESLRDFINEKFSKLEKHFDHITQSHVILEAVDNSDHSAEAEIHVPGEKIFAKSTASSAYAAIDTLIDKLDRQVIKYKEKLKSNKHVDKQSIRHEEDDDSDLTAEQYS